MLSVIRPSYYAFLGVFILTALLTIATLAKLWWIDPPGTAAQSYPFLWALISALILEPVALLIAFVRVGSKYMPRVEIHKKSEETFEFMCDYIKNGTSVTIVSNRLSLLTQSHDFLKEVLKEAKGGKHFEFITSSQLPSLLETQLKSVGVSLYVIEESERPEARFTLINSGRAGAERLAIAKGTHPEHEITIFDNDSGPHMIAMAKDIIRKSKNLANVP